MFDNAQIISLSDKVKFIESAFGAGDISRDSRNFAIWCPQCSPRDRSKKKLVIRLSDDANHCWTCTWRAKTLAPLLKKYSSVKEFNTYCDYFMNDEVKKYWITPDDAINNDRKIVLPADFNLLAPISELNFNTRPLLRYLSGRNITNNDMWYYKLGYSFEKKWNRRIVIPSFDAVGQLNYLVGRAIDSQCRRYENEDIDKTSIIFNEINLNWNKKLVLCEGPFDVMKCGDNATCLLGSSLNENYLLFNKIVMNNTPISLALDSSAMNNTLWIAKKLFEYNVDVSIVDLLQFKDPGEMTKSAFKEALESATPYDKLFEFRHKLKKASRVSLS